MAFASSGLELPENTLISLPWEIIFNRPLCLFCFYRINDIISMVLYQIPPQNERACGIFFSIYKQDIIVYNNLVKYYIAYNDARSEAHLVLLQNNYFAIITRTRVMSFKYNESSNLIELIEQRVFANSLVTDNGAGNLLYKLDTNNFAIEYPSKYALPYYHTFRLFLNISNNGKINISSVNFPSISYD